jgi:hypothetical protein
MATKLIFPIAGIFLLLALLPVAYSESTPAGGVGVKITLTDYDPSPAKPGKYVTLYLKTENSGGEELKDATFQLEIAYPFSFRPGEDGKKSVGSIGSQESILLEYTLNVDKTAMEDTYTLYLKLCLDKNCTTFARTPFDVSVQPGGTPKVEVGLEDASTFSTATKGTVTIHVVNRGILNTKFLAMELLPSENYDVISPARMYIGALDSDDIQTVDYTIYVRENVAVNESETIKLPVLVEYSDANDKEYSETTNVELKVYSKSDLARMQLVPDNSARMKQILYIIIGLAVIFLAYRYYKKKTS